MHFSVQIIKRHCCEWLRVAANILVVGTDASAWSRENFPAMNHRPIEAQGSNRVLSPRAQLDIFRGNCLAILFSLFLSAA